MCSQPCLFRDRADVMAEALSVYTVLQESAAKDKSEVRNSSFYTQVKPQFVSLVSIYVHIMKDCIHGVLTSVLLACNLTVNTTQIVVFAHKTLHTLEWVQLLLGVNECAHLVGRTEIWALAERQCGWPWFKALGSVSHDIWLSNVVNLFSGSLCKQPSEDMSTHASVPFLPF